MLLGLRDLLHEVAEDSTTSVGTDIAELSEGESTEAPVVTPTETEVEEEKELSEGEEEEEVPEGEEEVLVEGEEEEEESPEPESLDLHLFERPTIKQLNEAYPDLFKKFPSLRDMYFRESEYTKVFPTIEDAKVASENNVAFDSIRQDIFSGDGTKIFSAIKEVDEKQLERFSSKILPALFKIHPDAFWRAANPLIEDVARNMFKLGTKNNDEKMQEAAKTLSTYFFDTTEVAEGKKTTIIEDKTDPDLNKEREAFENERHTAFLSSIETSTKSKLIDMIEGKDLKTGKSRIDPDGVFSTFIQSTIIDHIIADLSKQLTADKTYVNYMNSLFSTAKKNGRTDADKSRIISAYLARAKSLIPTLRSKYVTEALGGKERQASQRKTKVETTESRRDGGSMGRGSNEGKKNYNPKSINYNKTSDEDILNDNISYK